MANPLDRQIHWTNKSQSTQLTSPQSTQLNSQSTGIIIHPHKIHPHDDLGRSTEPTFSIHPPYACLERRLLTQEHVDAAQSRVSAPLPHLSQIEAQYPTTAGYAVYNM